MIYIGYVTRVKDEKVWVTIEDLGGDFQFGPMNVPRPDYADLVDWTVEENYPKGSRVVIAQVGVIKEDLICLGKVA